MGYMVHHTIVVSSCNDALLDKAYLKAQEIFGDQVSNVVESVVNGYRSFFIAPDGSKEGWKDSDYGDMRRDEFVAWLDEQRYEDGSTSLGWVEVQFDDDELDTKVIRDNDSALRMKRERETQ